MTTLKTILIGAVGDWATRLEAELRRSGAEIESQHLDVEAALGASPPPPGQKRLFAVVVQGPTALPALRRLCESFPDQPVLVLSPMAGENGFAFEAMRIGVAQVVPLPWASDDLNHSVGRIAQQFGFERVAGVVVAVSGVSEGCGATTVAVNLANEIAHLTKRSVVVTEMGVRIGRLAVTLDVRPQYTTEDLLLNISSMDVGNVRRALTKVKERFFVLPATYKTLASASAGLSETERLIGILRKSVDVVVLDMPYTFDDVYFGLIGAADHIVLVAEQTVPSVHALTVVRDALRSRGALPKEHLVVNRYSTEYPGATFDEIANLLKTRHLLTIHSDGMGMMTALNNGQPLRSAAAHSPALTDIDRLVGEIFQDARAAASSAPKLEVLHKLAHLIGVD